MNAYLGPGLSQALGARVVCTCIPRLQEVPEVNRPSHSARNRPALGVQGAAKAASGDGEIGILA